MALLLVCGEIPDQAGTTPPSPTAEAASRVEEVIITSEQAGMRSSLDRRSFSLSQDLVAKTGSVADALRNVPSIEVDASGSVSLRGDPNVTILIDGKPSSLLNGAGRADALQQLPADQVERVEVLTTPSASDRPDGSGGIINLVMKKAKKDGLTGSARASATFNERRNAGASASFRKGTLTVSGDLGYRHDNQPGRDEVERETSEAGGTSLTRRKNSTIESAGDVWTVRAGVDYAPGEKTSLGAQARYRSMDYGARTSEFYTQTAGSDMMAVSSRASRTRLVRDATDFSGDLRRTFDKDRELTVHLSQERISTSRNAKAETFNEGDAPTLYETFGLGLLENTSTVLIDYSRNNLLGGKFRFGIDTSFANSKYDNRGMEGTSPNPSTPMPGRNGRSEFEQNTYAAYVTYERTFNDLKTQTGLRVEEGETELHDQRDGALGRKSRLRAYPSAHASYPLTDQSTLKASYARRVQRPGASDLNPFTVYLDPLNVRQGNPNLKPQITDNFELGWEYREEPRYFLLTAYYRETNNALTDAVSDLGDGILLTTRVNAGKARNWGLEAVANGRVTRTVTYNVSINALHSEFQAGIYAAKNAIDTVSGRANLTWQLTSRDLLQVSASTSGRRLIAQGYKTPSKAINLGYRHQLGPKLAFVATASDVTNVFGETVLTRTARFRDRSDRAVKVRGLFLGFTYAFGWSKPKDPSFNYEVSPGG